MPEPSRLCLHHCFELPSQSFLVPFSSVTDSQRLFPTGCWNANRTDSAYFPALEFPGLPALLPAFPGWPSSWVISCYFFMEHCKPGYRMSKAVLAYDVVRKGQPSFPLKQLCNSWITEVCWLSSLNCLENASSSAWAPWNRKQCGLPGKWSAGQNWNLYYSFGFVFSVLFLKALERKSVFFFPCFSNWEMEAKRSSDEKGRVYLECAIPRWE